MNHSLIRIGIACAAITILVIIAVNFIPTSSTKLATKIHFAPIPGAVVELYKLSKGSTAIDSTSKPVAVLSDGQEYSFDDQVYVVKVHGDDINPITNIVDGTSVRSALYISVDRTDAILSDTLLNEEADIRQALLSSYPGIAGEYSINPKLYGDGTWAAVTLSYTGKDFNQSDTLYIVMKKTMKWKIIGVPQITFSAAELPNDAPVSIASGTSPDKMNEDFYPFPQDTTPPTPASDSGTYDPSWGVEN